MPAVNEYVKPALDFLLCRTPDAWVDAAVLDLNTILIDHAANELKAAQAAITLLNRNPHKLDLLNKMSRLAREELVHFEQVLKILKKRDVRYQALKASRYGYSLAQHIRQGQQESLTDNLVIGAVIEARSCERFEKIAPHLDEDLSKFYLSLLKSESRHFEDYLEMARKYGDGKVEERVAFFLAADEESITEPDPLLRFHSGLPITKK